MSEVGQAERGTKSSSCTNYDTMLGRARALVPALRERAERTEQLRRLPPETEQDLHATGLFRLVQPSRVGGCEFDYVALIDFTAELARGDSSVAWNVANLGSHHWMLAMFEKAAQDRVWSDNPDALISSSFVFPSGRAQKVDGGYRISGRWPFCSGVRHSQWNMLGGLVASDDEGKSAEHRIFLVGSADYRILETWDTIGLRGTGSEDVAIDGVFVPQHMTLAVADVAGGPTPGASVNPGALYQLPVFALFPYVLSGVALGNSQACLEDFEISTRKRTSSYSRAKMADLQSIQIRLAGAAARVDAARRTEAVNTIFQASGAGGLFNAGALQRQFREAQAIASHIAFSFDAAGANYGRVALGLPSENPTL